MKKTKGTGVMLFGMFAIIVIIAVFILAGNGAKKEADDVCFAAASSASFIRLLQFLPEGCLIQNGNAQGLRLC